MEALVFRSGSDFFVSLTIAGEEVDVAGPFDDVIDAELAGLRQAGRVAPGEVSRSRRKPGQWVVGQWSERHLLAARSARKLPSATVVS